MKKVSIVRVLTALLVAAFFMQAGSLMLGLRFSHQDVFAAQTGNPTIAGVKDSAISQGEYINLYDGITAADSLGADITQNLLVSGNYDFSKAGNYDLVYSVADNEGNKATAARKISVVTDKAPSVAPPIERPVVDGVNELGKKGSFAAGTMSGMRKPRAIVNLADNLKQKPVPSSKFWTSLIIKDFGDRLVCNPLLVKYSNTGLAIANPGEGVASSNVDLNLEFKGISGSRKATVVDYSDFGVAVSLSDDSTCKMLTYLNQGSPYVFAKYSGGASPVVRVGDRFVAFYDDEFNTILASNGSTYTSDHIIVETRNGGSRPNNFWVVNAPQGTEFRRAANNSAELTLPAGHDYVSVGVAPSKETAVLAHEHGYAFVVATHRSFDVVDDTNEVITDYYHKIWLADPTRSPQTIMVLRPNQHMRSYNDFEDEIYKSVRGDTRVSVGNSFRTVDQFNGVIPSFVEPTNQEYSRSQLKTYLDALDRDGNGDTGNDVYWMGKTLQKIAQGALMADQIGETALRDKFAGKLRTHLVNWLTYDVSNEFNRERPYFYYDNAWGALLQYSNAYGFNTNLADHHFHLGMMVFACGVLAGYDKEFLNDYKEMVDLMVREYASPYREDPLFSYMRSFDIYAGHSWASGYNDNVSGGNQESSSESLNAYAGMYLWGVASGNEEIKKAGAYIFTTELLSVKEYWFNYSGTSFPDSYTHGSAGMIWGTSIAYGTWFSGAAHCIYGIQWIPTGEYLTSHVLDAWEQERFKIVHDFFLKDAGSNSGWRDLAYPMQSLVDVDGLMRTWNASNLNSIGNCDGNTGARVYMFVNNMKDLNRRTSLIWAKNQNSATFYEKTDGKVVAQVFNPSDKAVEFIFTNYAGDTQKYTAPAQSLTRVDVTIASVDPPERPPGWGNPGGGSGIGGNGPGNGGTTPDLPGEEGAPSAPQNFTAAASSKRVVLKWEAPADNGNSEITGYKISKDGGNTWDDVPAGKLEYTYTGLENGTAYDFKVRAVNTNGDGATASVSATPTDGKGSGGCGCGSGTIGINDIFNGIFLMLTVLLAASLLGVLRQRKRSAG